MRSKFMPFQFNPCSIRRSALPVFWVAAGLLAFCFRANAATSVSGLQSGNVTWAAAFSPYIVNGDVQVPVGSTLTIAPGVTVKYAGAYQIYVQGTLIANGTSGSPILFGSTTPGISSGATMLKFEGNNLSNSQLSY